jgi:hypothetical protein
MGEDEKAEPTDSSRWKIHDNFSASRLTSGSAPLHIMDMFIYISIYRPSDRETGLLPANRPWNRKEVNLEGNRSADLERID